MSPTLGRQRAYYRSDVTVNQWDAVLPGKILRVQHERRRDREGMCSLLDVCVSEFSAPAVEFTRPNAANDRERDQVSAPIFRKRFGSWRNFDPGSSLSKRLRTFA